jgi:2-oxoisovalerate dehydrogenase E1 component
MDPLAVHLAMTEAVEHMRPATARPSSRPTPTASSTRTALPGSAFGYRTKEEEQEWRERDPIDQSRPARPRGILTSRDPRRRRRRPRR